MKIDTFETIRHLENQVFIDEFGRNYESAAKIKKTLDKLYERRRKMIAKNNTRKRVYKCIEFKEFMNCLNSYSYHLNDNGEMVSQIDGKKLGYFKNGKFYWLKALL